MGYDLFISYASADLRFAEALHSRFLGLVRQARLNPGCDQHREIGGLRVGLRYSPRALRPRWKQSEWTRYETMARNSHPIVSGFAFRLLRDGDRLAAPVNCISASCAIRSSPRTNTARR
jgi:hypothetical protein